MNTPEIEKCLQYGVRLIQTAQGWHAWHLRGGATASFPTKQEAAIAAVSQWSL